MFIARVLFNSFLVTDFAVILDIFNHYNIQHAVTLNTVRKTVISSSYFLRFSSWNKNTSSIPHSYQKVGVILDTSSEGWRKDLESLDMAVAFKSPFSWIIVTEDLEETAKVLSHYPIEVDSNVIIIYKKDGDYSLNEIYNTGFALHGKVIVRNIGFWNNSLHIIRNHRWDLKGLVLRTTIVITKIQKFIHETFIEYLERERPSLTSVDSLHKIKYYENLKYYRDIFNISYIFQRSNSWGYLTNGSFDGMVGALQRYETDIGGSPIFVRADRAMAVDYAAETWATRPCFIFRHPKHPSGYYTIYTRPLSVSVWYCVVAFLVLTTFILGLMLRKSIRAPTDEQEESTSLAFLFIWGAICQQGVILSRSSTAVKMVVFITFVCAITLYQYYNALVVSALLQEPPKNIRTMEDLIASSLKAGVEDVLYNRDFFKRTTDPAALKMYNSKIVTKTKYNFYSAEVGMGLVKRGGFAFLVDNAVGYRIMQNTFSANELCDATEISMNWPQNTGVAVPRGSPYREHISYAIRMMTERGIMRRLKTSWDAARPICTRKPDSSLISVSILEFQTALIVLAVGYLAAGFVLCFEILNTMKFYTCCSYQLKRVCEFRRKKIGCL